MHRDGTARTISIVPSEEQKNECCISVRGIIVASWTVEGQTINKIILEDFVREEALRGGEEEAEPGSRTILSYPSQRAQWHTEEDVLVSVE